MAEDDSKAQGPQRLQRRRTRGYRTPDGAAYVGRPGPFGNPFSAFALGPEEAVTLHRLWLNLGATDDLARLALQSKGHSASAITADMLRRERLELELKRNAVWRGLGDLRGRDLLCWCAEGQPCHADTLLGLANFNCDAIGGSK